jgi:penicillin-binding protein 1A
MAAAFSTFAAGGVQHKPFWIRRVEDPLGRVLEEHIVRGQRSLDASIVYQVVDMMRGVLVGGTGRVIRRLGFDLPAAGKTGTTDDYRDAWFTGFTPTLSVSVWVGYDRGVSMRDVNGVGITGGRGAAPIWADFMIKATSGEPAREFVVPSDIHFATVDPINGAIAGPWVQKKVKVALRAGQTASDVPVQPTETVTSGPATEIMDEATLHKGDEPATRTVGQPFVESADKSAIREEELPPE